MPPSPLWRYFHHDKTHYKNDKTHVNAWCKACINAQKRVLMELDTSRVRAGETVAVRTPLELETAAIARVSPICGKGARMQTHIKSCNSLTDDERTLALGKTQIKLTDLFNYTHNGHLGKGLEFYWPGSIRNLEEDLLAHERAAAEAMAPTSSPSTV